jgi:hypothetical protein
MQDSGESNYSGVTICTYVVLVGTELAALSCDLFEVLLSGRIGIANLKQQPLFTDGLTMKLFNDLLTDSSGFEAIRRC